jgi:hypothetical protein
MKRSFTHETQMETSMKTRRTQNLIAAALVCAVTATTTQAQSHYDDLVNLPFQAGYIAKDHAPTLLDESSFQRAVQTYLWALPALNMYGMKEGSEKVFGKGYNVLPIFKQRLNAKTLITTPNSDVIYALLLPGDNVTVQVSEGFAITVDKP